MKILVIRLSSIGDIVLTTPVLRCLKTQLPDLELHMLVKIANVGMVDANPYVDRTIIYSDFCSEILGNIDYDYIVDLQCNYRSKMLCRRLHIPRLTFPKSNFSKAWLVAFKFSLFPITHVVDRYFEAVRSLGVYNDSKGLDFFLPEGVSMRREHPYVVIVAGSAHYTKSIPLEKVHYLASGMHKDVVLIGGKEDARRLEALDKPWPAHVQNLCGKTTLMQSASLLQGADWVVTPDTGMMHIATALGTKIMLIWGSTTPLLGFYPYQPKNTVVQVECKSCTCRPCSKLGRDKCPKFNFQCMRALDWNGILNKLNQ